MIEAIFGVRDYHKDAVEFEDVYGDCYEKMKAFAKTTRYYKEVRSLLNTLIKHGFKLVMVDDGEEFIRVKNRDEASTAMCNVDDPQLLVENPNGDEKWLMLVYGNEPGYIVSDYHVDPDLDKAVDEHYERWES